MSKILMKGNEAIGEAAIKAGCRHFFGYPITPQNELTAYLSRRMPQVNGVFLQAESEVAAINMVYGASSAGARVMTSSSGPGISLKQEGISYLCGAELPAVIVNVQRAGPGLGTIQAGQADYFQATKGGGHGDYRLIVLAPASVQEIVDLVIKGFDLSDKYLNPAMILADGYLGQMMEPVEFNKEVKDLPIKPWACRPGKKEGEGRSLITSIYIQPERMEKHNIKLQEKYKIIHENEQMAELWMMEDAEIVVVSYGITARIVKSAVRNLRKEGIKVGILRPITLWPFPEKYFNKLSGIKKYLVAELSAGQMIEDVRLTVEGRVPVELHSRMGGMVPSIEDIMEHIKKINYEIKEKSLV